MLKDEYNCAVLLGPTAVGKTSIGVALADKYDQCIISADSRQVYKQLDLGSGKDIQEYSIIKKNIDGTTFIKDIPYYLINITTLQNEYNVFNYQTDFYNIFNLLKNNSDNNFPIVVGGTGMYLDAIIRGYDFVPVPENTSLRDELKTKSLSELDTILLGLKPNIHNKSDLIIRDRVVRAIEIALYMKSPECQEMKSKMTPRPKIKPFIMGTTIDRDNLHKNIELRLNERISLGMIEEVNNIHKDGISWERLERLGLEYKYISLFLEGKISKKEEMVNSLYHEISRFAKRQETWFRGMEKKGVIINWLPKITDKGQRINYAISLLDKYVFMR